MRSWRFRATLVLLVAVCTVAAGWVSWQAWLKPGAIRGSDTRQAASDLARILGVGSIVEGSVEGSGNRIGVTVQLIDGVSGMHRFSKRIEGQRADVLTLRDTIVQDAVRLVVSLWGGWPGGPGPVGRFPGGVFLNARRISPGSGDGSP